MTKNTNIQAWLDNNYPLNGKCKIKGINFGEARSNILSIDFNSVALKSLTGNINFEGFDNLEEIYCNKDQFYYFFSNSHKLPQQLN